jgi:site-specific DNA recombinase
MTMSPMRFIALGIKKQKLLVENATNDELKNRLDEMKAILQYQPTSIIKYDEPLVRRLIEKLTVHEDKVTMAFKSGLNMDIDA